MNQYFHPEHFFCAQCGIVFSGSDTFLEYNSKAYCSQDYGILFAHYCDKCDQPLLSEHVVALGKSWHPHCFTCSDLKCNQILAFDEGGFFELDGEAYCENHFNARTGSICTVCHQTISGPCLMALKKAYHPHHFICSFCSKMLKSLDQDSEPSYCARNEKPYCRDCYLQLYG